MSMVLEKIGRTSWSWMALESHMRSLDFFLSEMGNHSENWKLWSCDLGNNVIRFKFLLKSTLVAAWGIDCSRSRSRDTSQEAAIAEVK